MRSPLCLRPETSITASFLQNLSIVSATQPRYQMSLAASICLSRLLLVFSASATIRSYVSARIVFLKIEPGGGGWPLGKYNFADSVHSELNNSLTVSIVSVILGTTGYPLRAYSMAGLRTSDNDIVP